MQVRISKIISKLLVSLIPMILSTYSSAGEWKKLGNSTLQFEGRIHFGDHQNFLNLMTEDIKSIEVNSRGGIVGEAILIGEKIFDFKLDIIVNGLCLSSCANYLFVAGKKKKIKSGLVGFHGNTTAMYKQNWEGTVMDMRSEGLSPHEIEEFKIDTLKEIALEREFFKKIGVKQALFDRTQRPDMGIGDNKKYDFLVPSIKTLNSYGIYLVEGHQDLSLAKKFNFKSVYQ
ncbi:MAG: hypothetical protein OEY33_01540 [Bdellovibrionales bacterium]|nr:hypothetical protein [Bdellovibrionales bacterium]